MAEIVRSSMGLTTGASYTSGINLGDGEFNRFSIIFPTTNPLTAASDIFGATSFDGITYSRVAYSVSPATATSTLAQWSCSQTSWGKNTIAEAPLFGRYFRLEFATAATQNATFYMNMGKD